MKRRAIFCFLASSLVLCASRAQAADGVADRVEVTVKLKADRVSGPPATLEK